jgi:uncharacterized protein YbjQ (UPF0145 family)
MSDVMVTTMNDLPGYRIGEVYGEVFGLTVRSRNIGSDIGASLRGIIGGEVKGYTKMLVDSRLQAVERLRDAARDVGANAVVAMRFDCNELGGNMTEVAAYGTAARSRAPERHAASAARLLDRRVLEGCVHRRDRDDGPDERSPRRLPARAEASTKASWRVWPAASDIGRRGRHRTRDGDLATHRPGACCLGRRPDTRLIARDGTHLAVVVRSSSAPSPPSHEPGGRFR